MAAGFDKKLLINENHEEKIVYYLRSIIINLNSVFFWDYEL